MTLDTDRFKELGYSLSITQSELSKYPAVTVESDHTVLVSFGNDQTRACWIKSTNFTVSGDALVTTPEHKPLISIAKGVITQDLVKLNNDQPSVLTMHKLQIGDGQLEEVDFRDPRLEGLGIYEERAELGVFSRTSGIIVRLQNGMKVEAYFHKLGIESYGPGSICLERGHMAITGHHEGIFFCLLIKVGP